MSALDDDKVTPLGHAPWTAAQAEATYHMRAWGDQFFYVNDAGHVEVRSADGPAIDLRAIAAQIEERGIGFPALVRFQDILRARVHAINGAFKRARKEFRYSSRYLGVYPIKVNQMHEVVDEILEAGREYGVGLECGSKAELVAALALLETDDTLLICNGYKDETVLGLILDAQRLGKNVIPVMEKLDEFERLWQLARQRKMVPRFGVRMRLSASSGGHWADSSGDRSKFGISFAQLLRIVRTLERSHHGDALALLHFHLGSQIPDIMSLADGVKELCQVYVQLAARGIVPQYLDVGGGLGVNYDAGFGRVSDVSINYTLQEYANTVVSSVKEVCDAAGAPLPILVSESGRALTAHHSVLLVPVLGAYGSSPSHRAPPRNEEEHALVTGLRKTHAWVRERPPIGLRELLEAYHDAMAARREAGTSFRMGYLSLEDSAVAEELYWQICWSIYERVATLDPRTLPNELLTLDDLLVEQYLCDFSVFQSMLDHWAIGQRFPIVPLQRLDERPDRRAILVDLTCDSDGKVARYVSLDPDRSFLDVHALREHENYYLGIFLMGAYQDIMGDSHNLFGRVPEVHVYADADEPEGFYIEKIIPGTQVGDILSQVQYFTNDLARRMSTMVREKIDAKVLRPKEGIEILERYKAMFTDSTYFRPTATEAAQQLADDGASNLTADGES